jgi:hypothetical protein
MYSKKNIWGFRVGIKTYKNHKVPKQLRKLLGKSSTVKVLQRTNNKRARTLNYNLIRGFE